MTGGADRVDRQRRGGAAAAVEPVEAPLAGIPDEGERVAAEAAGVAVDDGEHRVRRDGRVDGGAAALERLDAGRRRERMRRDDHPVRRYGWASHVSPGSSSTTWASVASRSSSGVPARIGKVP